MATFTRKPATATIVFNQVAALVSTFSSKEGAEFYSSKRESLIEKKTMFMQKLAEVGPFLDMALSACTAFSSSPKINMAVNLTRLVKVTFKI